MGFVQRAFTPPGTGGREAAAIQAQTDAAAAQAKAAQAKAMPALPQVAAGPPGPTLFSAGLSPGPKQKLASGTQSFLGAAATAGQSSQKSASLG